MSTLIDYLAQKREALEGVKARAAEPGYKPVSIDVTVTAEGRSGIRRARVRGFQIVSDSPPDFAGYDLGPSSPEIALSALGSCLTHTWLIQAAAHGLPLKALSVEVHGILDPRAGSPWHEAVPREPHGLDYTVHIETDAPEAAIAEVRAAVEKVCPILNLLRNPQTIAGRVSNA
ncbi:OsmC family peroxiredoxin [Rhodovarius crocodyli]|uniref:OsmC family peroxiredoxin n=1 Tax=Rhodovarius crocodyli TaxID=1979269 RepID=A0A437M295_9PROT|nr:OsmC family protein [Rhodovarius crocodyli]RVT91634.1 OsmC family peroxiredoxin [Rhodovarius crocodyli]